MNLSINPKLRVFRRHQQSGTIHNRLKFKAFKRTIPNLTAKANAKHRLAIPAPDDGESF